MYPTLVLPTALQAYLIWRFGDFFIAKSKGLYYNVRVSMSIQSTSLNHPSFSCSCRYETSSSLRAVIIAIFLLFETGYFAFCTIRSYGEPGLKDAKLGSEFFPVLLNILQFTWVLQGPTDL